MLAGTGTSQEDGVTIAVRLEREAKDNTVDYEGTITRGTSELSFSSADNAAISADEFRNSQSTDGNIVTNPANFSEVSPEAIFVRVERRATLDLVKSLRAENVKLTLDSLVQDCAALRSGSQLVRIEVDPQRAPALVAKLRGIGGVVQAGWTHGTYSLENAIALDPAAWQGADARERLMTAVASAAAQFFNATAGASTWDAASGVTTLKFKRPNTTVPGLGFTDTIEVAATVGLDKPTDGKRLVLWIGEASIATTDEGEGQRLGLITSSGNENDPGETISAAELTATIARELKGQTWDTDRAAWK